MLVHLDGLEKTIVPGIKRRALMLPRVVPSNY
jgi:hypothetical protein